MGGELTCISSSDCESSSPSLSDSRPLETTLNWMALSLTVYEQPKPSGVTCPAQTVYHHGCSEKWQARPLLRTGARSRNFLCSTTETTLSRLGGGLHLAIAPAIEVI